MKYRAAIRDAKYKEDQNINTYHHQECRNPGGSPSVMFFSHRIWERGISQIIHGCQFNKNKIKRLIHEESFGRNDFAVQISNRDSTYNFLLFVSERRKLGKLIFLPKRLVKINFLT